jgi:hypothetical protein
MKPFNLAEAKAGKPVITRDGKKVVEIQIFNSEVDKPIIGLVGSKFYAFTKNGKSADDNESAIDLFMGPEKKTIWVNVHHCGNTLALGRGRYPTEAEAREKITNKETYIKTIKIAVE